MTSKSFRILLLFLVLGTTHLYPLEIKNDKDAIVALSKRLLGIKNMLEVYSMIGMGLKYKNPNERLKKDMKEARQISKGIKKLYQDDKFILDCMHRVKKAWKPLGKIYNEINPSLREKMRKDAPLVNSYTGSVTAELIKMKKHITETSKLKNIKLINATTNISLSSQGLASQYMMKVWKMDDPLIKKHWDKNIKLYKNGIELLKKSSYYQKPTFKKLLDDSAMKLNFFEIVFDQERPIPSLVDKRANSVKKNGFKMVKILLE